MVEFRGVHGSWRCAGEYVIIVFFILCIGLLLENFLFENMFCVLVNGCGVWLASS